MSAGALPPIRRSVSVSWDPETALRRFTADFGAWWPHTSLSIGGPRVRRVVFEMAVGGRIYEEHTDGRRFQWGRVCLWEPPVRVRFTWHPSREESAAQDVEVRFVPEGSGTRLELTSTGWERWGPKAHRAHRRYDLGWATVLDYWAERRTPRRVLMRAMGGAVQLIQGLRGGSAASIARARGEMPPS